jgi:Ca2+-binding EF-hand superfamily protein
MCPMRNLSVDSGKNTKVNPACRDLLTPRRAAMVDKAFNRLDMNGSGELTPDDIATIYDVSMNPEFVEGRKTKDQILSDFLGNFEGKKGNNDGVITKDEFVDYYTDLSMSVPSDEYFVRMMESTWQQPEDDNTAAVKQTVQHLLVEVRARTLELARNDPKFVKKVFSDFDLNQSGHLTIDEMTNMIAKLKISVERKYVYPFFKVIDANNSGGIEYPEFEHYLVNNPY